MWTQKGLSKQSFLVGATAPVPEIPSGYVHIAYMALNLISLWNSQGLLAVGILYHKNPAQNVSVHNGCRGIVVDIL